MPAPSRCSIASLSVIVCAMSCGDLVWGQEYLPTLRNKHPSRSMAWAGDSDPTAGVVVSDRQSKPVAVASQISPSQVRPMASDSQDRALVVPKTAIARREPVRTEVPAAANVPGRVVAVSDQHPVVKDRRAATLQALSDGFRGNRPASPAAVMETTTVPRALPVSYAAASDEEPAPRDYSSRELPAHVEMPTQISPQVQISTAAPTAVVTTDQDQDAVPVAAENAMPATVEMLPPIAAETAPETTSARFIPVEETTLRPETWQARTITNPLRRAIDSISPRRNPLRSAD